MTEIKFRPTDIINSKNHKIKEATVTYVEDNKIYFDYEEDLKESGWAYSKNIYLVKRSDFEYIKQILNDKISVTKKFIYDYNPLNYRIIHKDNIDQW